MEKLGHICLECLWLIVLKKSAQCESKTRQTGIPLRRDFSQRQATVTTHNSRPSLIKGEEKIVAVTKDTGFVKTLDTNIHQLRRPISTLRMWATNMSPEKPVATMESHFDRPNQHRICCNIRDAQSFTTNKTEATVHCRHCLGVPVHATAYALITRQTAKRCV